MNEALKSNLANGDTWMRLVYMILFTAVFGFAAWVTGFVVVVQFLFKLFSGETNEHLSDFGGALAAYFGQIVAFLTFQAEDKPYPFAPWPQPSTRAAPRDAVTES